MKNLQCQLPHKLQHHEKAIKLLIPPIVSKLVVTSIPGSDNASANHQMAQEIQFKFPTFVAEKNTIGCMVHIIHLAACDGLKALEHANGPTQTEAQEPQGQMDLSNLIDKADSLYLKYD
ncbi:hypothetical protein O181_074785 [Austropuccinia psidii MF-1]|uniref:Uncharacterized protein n=1 Tax=Austropuccinia psidii MF-1 TaxID=1389203 RepID=A0A9Q3FD42_9BASI|nr:hypothetical protein [Austropuccinia psidii MF-1]